MIFRVLLTNTFIIYYDIDCEPTFLTLNMRCFSVTLFFTVLQYRSSELIKTNQTNRPPKKAPSRKNAQQSKPSVEPASISPFSMLMFHF